MDISIIIVSYNVRYYLEQCLHSIYSAISGIECEILVVDNASSDHTVEYIRNKFPSTTYPNLHLVANSHNAGFGRANNQGIRHAKGKYILFLNPDTLLTESTLRDSLNFAEKHPDMGGLGTMMLHTDGTFASESRRGLPTPWTAFCKMCGLASLFPKSRIFGKYYMRYLDAEKSERIEIISGAYMMVRRDVLDKSGMFDEAFFMYGEDIDLSYRILKAGFNNYYIPSPILHYKGESTKKNSYRYVHVFYGAMLIFFRKHFHHYRWGLSVIIKTAIFVRALIALLSQQIVYLKKFLFPSRVFFEGKQLYIGTHGNTVSRLACQWGMDMDLMEFSEETLPTELLMNIQTKGYRHIIYDTDDFSRDYILNFFRKSNHKSAIGTFSPQTALLITGASVFDLQTDNAIL